MESAGLGQWDSNKKPAAAYLVTLLGSRLRRVQTDGTFRKLRVNPRQSGLPIIVTRLTVPQNQALGLRHWNLAFTTLFALKGQIRRFLY